MHKLFEPARAQLDKASAAVGELHLAWNSHPGELFNAHVEINANGDGRVFVTCELPSELSKSMEVAASSIFKHLKLAMDLAILATANRVSGVFGAADEATHVMPLTDTPSAFDLLVPLEALQCLRPDQVRVVRQFQPFAHGSDGRDFIGKHMTQLAAQLRTGRSGPRVAFWTHSAKPELRARDTSIAQRLAVEPDGVLVDSKLVATFVADPAIAGHEISCNPNVAFDLVLNDPPWPNDPDDTIGPRLRAMTLIVGEFINALERSVVEPSLLRSIGSLGGKDPQQVSSLWMPVHFDNPDDRDAAHAAIDSTGQGFATHRGPQGMFTLLREVDGNLVGRQFGEASAPDIDKPFEAAIEHASLKAAAVWGLPDFVFLPRSVSKGSGVREVGDGTIVSGQRGLALQVKARETVTTNPDRESSWVQKKAAEGARQALGSIRTSLALSTVRLSNLRGREVAFDGTAVEWAPVVIIDHSDPPENLRLSRDQTLGALVLLRRDWEFLWDQLRSASAVVDYVFRVLGEAPEPLGEEAARYMDLAQADLRAEPGPTVSWAAPLGGVTLSGPLLPTDPPDAQDGLAHRVFTQVLNDIANTSFTADEHIRLHVLGLIDRVPVTDRADLGRLLLKRLEHCARTPPDQTWVQHRVMLLDHGRLHLAFSVMSVMTQRHQDIYTNWLLLRREQFQEAAALHGDNPEWSIGVLLTPRPDGPRLWDTTVVAVTGPPSLERSVRADLERAFPVGGSGRVVK